MTDVSAGPGRDWRPVRRLLLGLGYQAAAVAAVAALLAYFALNAAENLATRGLHLGFGFLSQEAGFRIGFSIIDFTEADSYGRAFLVGLVNTLLAVAISIVLATALGFAIGIARLSTNWPLSRLALGYVELVRNLPLLLHLLFWYNVALRALPPVRQSLSLGGLAFLNNRGILLPRPVLEADLAGAPWSFLAWAAIAVFVWVWNKRRQAVTGEAFPAAMVIFLLVSGTALLLLASGLASLTWELPVLRGFDFTGGLRLTPELAALIFALTVYNASFIAELVRGSILAVDQGQTEAAKALGLGRGRILRLVVIPQALRVLIPPLSNQYLHLLKASSLATAIGYPDLVNVFTGTVLNQTGRAIEIVLITMLVYLTLSAVVALATNVYNRLAAIVEN
ncbi:MAG: ABC transporter permease subunit [Proteobacteria bacterium]|nr:ABC transporter permease subunit [Pseudomonadota bacterium]MBI3496379.1 ABC transporter permease subunit [Pseudomonadota bacterium]